MYPLIKVFINVPNYVCTYLICEVRRLVIYSAMEVREGMYDM